MKTILKISTIIICITLFTGCSKNDVVLTPGEQAIKNLTGDGNRYWHLSKIFDNNVPQTLTSDQLKYTKTYTINPANRFTGNAKLYVVTPGASDAIVSITAAPPFIL